MNDLQEKITTAKLNLEVRMLTNWPYDDKKNECYTLGFLMRRLRCIKVGPETYSVRLYWGEIIGQWVCVEKSYGTGSSYGDSPEDAALRCVKYLIKKGVSL